MHPAKLVKGLADGRARRWAWTIHEQTPVTEIGPTHAVTPYGTVRAARHPARTEGFTANLEASIGPGCR